MRHSPDVFRRNARHWPDNDAAFAGCFSFEWTRLLGSLEPSFGRGGALLQSTRSKRSCRAKGCGLWPACLEKNGTTNDDKRQVDTEISVGPAERAAAVESIQLGRKTGLCHAVAEGAPLPALGRRSRGGGNRPFRIARESGREGDARRETTSRPAPRPPAQTTRTPLAPSLTYCGAAPGVAAA